MTSLMPSMACGLPGFACRRGAWDTQGRFEMNHPSASYVWKVTMLHEVVNFSMPASMTSDGGLSSRSPCSRALG